MTTKNFTTNVSMWFILLVIGLLLMFSVNGLISLFTPYENNSEPEFDFSAIHYETGVYTKGSCEYEYYAEKMYPENSSLSTFYSIVNSESELYENMSNEYSYEMNLDYDKMSIAILKGKWDDIGCTKASIVIHSNKETYVRNYYMDIITYGDVTKEQFTEVCNELLDKLINNI